MTCDDSSQQSDGSVSLIKPRMGQRIDQILDLAGKNKAQAIQEALRLRKWLEQQQTTGQAEVDRQAVLEEIKLLIDLIRKS